MWRLFKANAELFEAVSAGASCEIPAKWRHHKTQLRKQTKAAVGEEHAGNPMGHDRDNCGKEAFEGQRAPPRLLSAFGFRMDLEKVRINVIIIVVAPPFRPFRLITGAYLFSGTFIFPALRVTLAFPASPPLPSPHFLPVWLKGLKTLHGIFQKFNFSRQHLTSIYHVSNGNEHTHSPPVKMPLINPKQSFDVPVFFGYFQTKNESKTIVCLFKGKHLASDNFMQTSNGETPQALQANS